LAAVPHRSLAADQRPGRPGGSSNAEPQVERHRVDRRDPTLAGHRAIWAATHPAADDATPLSARETSYLSHLQDRSEAARTGQLRPAQERWRHLVTAVDPRLATSTAWPDLAEQLDIAFTAGIDIDSTLPALAHRHGNTQLAQAVQALIDDARLFLVAPPPRDAPVPVMTVEPKPPTPPPLDSRQKTGHQKS
jgi:hypothetical protein